ncbi:MAG: ISAs1 family transposase, partial [Planctomycetota bacterium]
MGAWAKANEDWLKSKLPLPEGIPSHDTIGRGLAALKPKGFQECFAQWVQSVSQLSEKEDAEQVAIDGKALRRSYDSKKSLGPLFLVSAWSASRGISLGQLATEEKSNEITAIPELLDNLDVSGTVVTIDAAGCQKSIVAKIIAGKGDYVIAIKGNQPTLFNLIANYFADHLENDFADIACRQSEERIKGHDREDTVRYYQFNVPAKWGMKKVWKGLRTVAVAVRSSVSKGKETSDVRYYISSRGFSVAKHAGWIRNHWSIENTLHWCLDVTFREDENRTRNHILANNLAWLRRFAISLLKQVDDKQSVAMRRRVAGWNVD